MLIISFCFAEVECNNLTKAYMSHNVQLKQNIKTGSKKAVKLTSKEFAFTTAVAYTAIGRHRLRARLPYRFIAEWKFEPETDKTVTLNWRYDF